MKNKVVAVISTADGQKLAAVLVLFAISMFKVELIELIPGAPSTELTLPCASLLLANTRRQNTVTAENTCRAGSSGASDCSGMCVAYDCVPSGFGEDVVTIGIQGDKAVIRDLGIGRSCWAWNLTWTVSGSAGE